MRPGTLGSLLVQQDVSRLEHRVCEQARGSIVLLPGSLCLWGEKEEGKKST